MATAGLVILEFFILILFSINVNVSEGNTGLLSNLLKTKQQGSALIILINRPPKEPNYDPLRTGDNNVIGNQIDIDEKSVQIAKDIVKSTGNKNDPAVIEINKKFKQALRSQCESYVQCTIKCEVKVQKKKEDCQKSCKAIFDYLMMCHPPGGKGRPKRPRDPCENDECRPRKWGKTMPPKWLLRLS